MIVSDSEPLSNDDLVLCQRIEHRFDSRERKLNVLRECIRPGTIIKFRITIDRELCDITEEKLEKAIEYFSNMYYESFLSKYKAFDRPVKNNVWLGGGVGFVSKTAIYPLMGTKEGINTCVKVFKAAGFTDKHKHHEDIKDGVSPHICKATYYRGKRYQIGLCRIKFTEL